MNTDWSTSRILSRRVSPYLKPTMLDTTVKIRTEVSEPFPLNPSSVHKEYPYS